MYQRYQRHLFLSELPLLGTRLLNGFLGNLERLSKVGTSRDKAGNWEFFGSVHRLLLLYFFNPTVTSLRGLREITELETTQRQMGCDSVSRSALSETGGMFDPEPLHAILTELGM